MALWDEDDMAKATTSKKRGVPTKACPNCGKPIHARSKKHEACGWVIADYGEAKAAPVAAAPAAQRLPSASPPRVKRFQQRRPLKALATGITGEDVQSIKSIKDAVDRLGAERVAELVEIFK